MNQWPCPISFDELKQAKGLKQVDQAFLSWLKKEDEDLYDGLLALRQGKLSHKEHSDWMLQASPILEDFLAHFFAIEEAVSKRKIALEAHSPILAFKAYYVKKQAKRYNQVIDNRQALCDWVKALIQGHSDGEYQLAKQAMSWLDEAEKHQKDIERMVRWCRLMLDQKEDWVKDWVIFRLPTKVDPMHLVPLETLVDDPYGRKQGPSHTHKKREGMGLTDHGMKDLGIQNEVDYCVYCHKNEGDFCRSGFPIKKNDPDLGLKNDAFDHAMTGCPLEEHISEMHMLRHQGHIIAPLAVVMIENPLCPLTGHRICNDCMKACIYQKQTPVNIPEVESGVLKTVLDLPWGPEIYQLLVLWNPLRSTQWLPKERLDDRVMVMGLGPSGLTLMHHLWMQGYQLMGLDGLKIEAIRQDWLDHPIKNYSEMKTPLDTRTVMGVGGVAEYGITARWDKNFLSLIYLTLARRHYCHMAGGIRFGGTLTVEDVWKLGYDHLALAVGAGLPKELSIPHSLAPGMRQANDFLMALQLTGALKKEALASLQLSLPAIVIGGGLTGIDTATEVQAYYLVQIEKLEARYQDLVDHQGEDTVRAQFSQDALAIIDQQLMHARALKKERAQARAEGRPANTLSLIRQWGGVSVVYRKKMQDSPAYQRNHEEVIQALSEGIYYLECLAPVEVVLDAHGHVDGLVCQSQHETETGWVAGDKIQTLPARAIFVATGAKPNCAYAFEHPKTFERERYEYQAYHIDEALRFHPVETPKHCKHERWGPFTSYDDHDGLVSFVGDAHPAFHGSVVKAMASAKRTYPEIDRILTATRMARLAKRAMDQPASESVLDHPKAQADHWLATLVKKENVPDGGTWLTVRFRQGAMHAKLGHWFRVQRHHLTADGMMSLGEVSDAVSLALVGLDQDQGWLTFFVWGETLSERLLLKAHVGERLSVMGPTGVRTSLPKTPGAIGLFGDKKTLPLLLFTAQTMASHGLKVYAALWLEHHASHPLMDALDAISERVTYLVKSGPLPKHRYAQYQDQAVAQTLMAEMPLDHCRSLLDAEGTQRIQSWIPTWREQGWVHAHTRFHAAVFGPMQCGMKGVCAQCLQWQIDPETGERTKAVYACSWQEQPMTLVDFKHLKDRQRLHEPTYHLNAMWYAMCQEGKDG